MRLFVAVLPPPEVLAELDRFLTPHRADRPELRWVPREQMHITVAFLGEAAERPMERVLPRLERAAARYPKIALSFAGAGAFPGGGAHARVLWTGVYGERGTLARMAASMNAAGRRAGFPMNEHKGFRPHLTLARCRRPTDVRPLLEELGAYASPSWAADSVHLMCSHPPTKQNERPRYEIMNSWPLA